MPVNTLLYEIAHGEWLMEERHLRQLHETVRMGFSETNQGAVPSVESRISFFNEDQVRFRPSNASEIPEGSIAVVDLVGPMMKYGNWFALGADEVIAQLDLANDLKNISAIVANVDGPGGSVAAIGPFLEFASRKKKPIVAFCDAALSLHYWVSCAIADHIMAANTVSARFGSIGVMTRWRDASEYWEKLGVKDHEEYPAESQHKNEVARKLKENEKEGKKMLVEMHLKPLAQKFQAAVKTARPFINEGTEGTMTGRTFGAEDALENRMIDSIGSLQQAMRVAQALGELKSI